MVAINIVPEQDSLVPRFVEDYGLTFPVLLGADANQVVEDYNLVATPLNLILDEKGEIAFRFDGYRAGIEDYLERQIQEQLGLK